MMNELYQNNENQGVELNWSELSLRFTKRRSDAHKGDFGHVLVIGGDHGMPGAVRMAAESALRVGAGLVSVATRQEHLALISAARPEVMCHGIQTSVNIEPLLKKATVIVIGPGLGKSEWSRQLWQAVLNSSQPKVVDADALNLLAEFPQKNSHWILTPHPGEAARLLQRTSEQIQENRLQSANDLLNRFDGLIILKGANTIVQGEYDAPFRCAKGNPGMATAGMGDVLSGVLGGLLAQGFSLSDAAKTGVMLHAMAADAAAIDGGERGLLATDLMPYLRKLVNSSGSGSHQCE